MEADMHRHPYRNLALQTLVSGIIMYFVMFVMIDTLGSFYNNLNMVYMTMMMVAPMVAVMLLAMSKMYPSKSLNMTILIVSAGVFVGSFGAIRTQTGIGNAAFLRSMIPHHSGAILMCGQAKLTDPEIIALCGRIDDNQKQEIAQMKAILERQ